MKVVLELALVLLRILKEVLGLIKDVNDLQDKPEGLDVSVLPTGSVSGLPVAPHPYG